ncbi:MAG: hypothetical protein HFJ55_02175 [Clostridia bacterium]|jgi:flagellar motility protein MotE (MotC chaperone)|nr:hypothetical protein [Clostridia bacterium]
MEIFILISEVIILINLIIAILLDRKTQRLNNAFIDSLGKQVVTLVSQLNNRDQLIKDLTDSKEKDQTIKNYQKDLEILLNNAEELRSKIVDLENNIELLVNNSENDKIKELVNDSQSNN